MGEPRFIVADLLSAFSTAVIPGSPLRGVPE
jgi:hypothetical protein